MTEQATPQIDLKLPEAAMCARHGEPFRKAWPAGFAQLVILALEVVQADAQLAAEAAGDVTKINAALLARPACERVPLERIRQAYLAAEIAVDDVCVVCGRRAPGTEYQRTVHRSIAGVGLGKRTVVDRHVCFECVLTRMAPA